MTRPSRLDDHDREWVAAQVAKAPEPTQEQVDQLARVIEAIPAPEQAAS